MKTYLKGHQMFARFWIVALCSLFCFTGCNNNPQPQAPTVITKYKEVPVPVRCQVEMPVKPVYNKAKPKTAKALTEYYLICEDLLKKCLGIEDKKENRK